MDGQYYCLTLDDYIVIEDFIPSWSRTDCAALTAWKQQELNR